MSRELHILRRIRESSRLAQGCPGAGTQHSSLRWLSVSTTTPRSTARQPRFLVVAGHPDPQSYSHALAHAYANGAQQAGAAITFVDLAATDFDPVLRMGYRDRMPESPFIASSQNALVTCDHMVLAFPTWWSAEPSLLKGWFDRVLTPGIAYRYRAGKLMPERLLDGRTGTIITTSHAPGLWTRLTPWGSVFRVGRAVLGYCGVRVTQRLVLGSMEGENDTPQRRQDFLKQTADAAMRQVEDIKRSR